MNAKKAGAAAVVRRSAQAIEVYEKAMKALGKKDHAKAREHFEALLGSYAEERDVAERARLYLAVCQRALEKKSAFKPKSTADQIHYGVYLHNRGEHEEALKCFTAAAADEPKNEHAQYCSAAAAAQTGDAALAIKSLRAAVKLNEANRTQARYDADFEPLSDNEEFSALLDGDEPD